MILYSLTDLHDLAGPGFYAVIWIRKQNRTPYHSRQKYLFIIYFFTSVLGFQSSIGVQSFSNQVLKRSEDTIGNCSK